MATVVVAGAVAGKLHNGGEAWVRLSWVRAFQQLGFEVYLVEEVAGETLVDAGGRPSSLAGSENLAYFGKVMRQFGLEQRCCLVSSSGERWGTDPAEMQQIASGAEMLVNVSGNLSDPDLLGRFRRRVYLDIDPGFTQYWHARGLLGPALERHTSHFTIGENVGRAGCPIPTGDFHWHPTRQPVVLADWPACPSDACDRLTTVGSLRGPYGRVEHAGGRYGLKIHEMRRVAALPGRVEPVMELALGIGPGDGADGDLLAEAGWRLVDPGSAAPGPQGFRGYVQGSDGEFSVAQGIYVETGSGWFSDRTVRYLASAKPVIVQDTGMPLPAGEGLLTFRTLDDAAAAVEAVRSDYGRHSRAARKLAEESFEAGRVAGALAEVVGVAP
ncbi:MAG TPA: hypothetical protein VHL54_13790 [Actinomycetota bacterium]|nr:hypothetical protein [Actinomycetota bacterium]